MPSPRLQVVLPEKVYRDLARIARYSDQSMSAIVASMVVEGAEVLHQLADTLEQAHGLSVRLPGAVQAKLASITDRLEGATQDAQEGLDLIQSEVSAHIDKHGGDAAPRSSAGGERGGAAPPPAKGAPPYINKGVRK